jgi:short subunit dehydrogenase-like uncharacterized protein
MTNKIYDVIVWGASGFTGRLVAEYLYKQYGVGDQLKWAMAGRNEEKLLQVRGEIGNSNIPIIIADSRNKMSLDAMTAQTKVICTTVGPYALYGSELVASCIANKADYCDLSGEVQWMRKMIDIYHEEAVKEGVRIVHTCGFDSIPSDMGVFYLQKMSKNKFNAYCHHIRFRLKAAKGGFSGGTYASLNNVLVEAEKDKSIMDILTNPYGLNPDPRYKGPDFPDLRTVVYDNVIDSWITPFVMAAINTKVVRRSHALAAFPYGEDFRYDEAIMTGKGLGGRLKAFGNAAGLGFLMAAKPGSLMKKVVDKFLPDPGEGPDKEARENGFFNINLYGTAMNGQTIVANVKGDKDPGYGSTSKMLGESAVCLALDKKMTPITSGILTPSVAMGDVLLNRLQENAGLTFSLRT